MTYDALETGAQSGKPVELYEFTHGTNVYRYTSAEADITHQLQTYSAQPLSRSAIEATQEMARGSIKLSCARTLPLLDLFKIAPPSDVITVVIKRVHRGDSEAVVIWMGRILNVQWRGGLQSEIHCESIYTSIKRPGLRRMYQKQCPHVLYSTQCGVSKSAYKVTRTVASVSGLGVTMSDMGSFESGRFAGGYIEWMQSGIAERRSIRQHAGAVLTINFQAAGLTAGVSVDIYPGCDHTIAVCNSKFSNSANYGGMPFIPTKNPFNGTPVF